jgi:diacylglycerol kinase family enzyme
MSGKQQVHVLINPDSGIWNPFNAMAHAFLEHWETPDRELTIQFSTSKEDGRTKARKAVEKGADILLVVGGDGAVNTVGSQLVGSQTALGVIPSGSGNGFARHFGIPMDIRKAIAVLAKAEPRAIDVGFADDKPFFVTCSLAWDASLVEAFEKSPIRGILPYVFAAVYQFFEYKPQVFRVNLDDREELHIEDPMLFTAANLTQYGGGAMIAPGASADDGLLQLVTLRKRDLPWVLPMLGSVFNGTIDRLDRIGTHSFETMVVSRKTAGPMQLDGELIQAPAEVRICVHPRALKVLVPPRYQTSNPSSTSK